MVITHNMKNKKLLLGIAWAWLICLSANAEVKLPAFFSRFPDRNLHTVYCL